jgi:serine/threonine protein kinase
LLLTDFGISRKMPAITAECSGLVETSGTPGYMAPETLCRMPHGYTSDFFAIGVIVYEMMFRRRPYSGTNKNQIRDNILAK